MNCSRHGVMLCNNCGVSSNSFKILTNDPEPVKDMVNLDYRTSEKVINSHVNCEKFRLLHLLCLFGLKSLFFVFPMIHLSFLSFIELFLHVFPYLSFSLALELFFRIFNIWHSE